MLRNPELRVSPHIAGAIKDVIDKKNQGENRIPAADNGKEVFFQHRELMWEFAGHTLIAQSAFLRVIRAIMTEQEVAQVIISNGRTRGVKITWIGQDAYGALEIRNA
jgi:hypothetical protein